MTTEFLWHLTAELDEQTFLIINELHCVDLTVLYEHKTRLENAVSQEKEIAKKAKDGTSNMLLLP